MTLLRKAIGEVWPFLLLALAVAVFPIAVNNHYFQFLGALIGLYTLMAVGLCLLQGYAGQISLGHAAFYGMGAYSTAILTTRVGLDPWLALVAGIVMTCIVAYIVGKPTLRLHGHYLAMATLGFGIIVQILLTEGREITGGFSGIPGIPGLRIGSFEFDGDVPNYYLVWGFAVAAMVISNNIVHSRIGRAMRAIHDSEVAAESCGVNVGRCKLQIFVLSAGFAAIAGSLYANYITFISPGAFGLTFSIQLVVMVIVGGARSIWGALLGTSLMTIVSQQIEKIDAISDMNVLVYGLVLMAFVILMPNGLAALLDKGKNALVRRMGGEAHA